MASSQGIPSCSSFGIHSLAFCWWPSFDGDHWACKTWRESWFGACQAEHESTARLEFVVRSYSAFSLVGSRDTKFWQDWVYWSSPYSESVVARQDTILCKGHAEPGALTSLEARKLTSEWDVVSVRAAGNERQHARVQAPVRSWPRIRALKSYQVCWLAV